MPVTAARVLKPTAAPGRTSRLAAGRIHRPPHRPVGPAATSGNIRPATGTGPNTSSCPDETREIADLRHVVNGAPTRPVRTSATGTGAAGPIKDAAPLMEAALR